MLLRQIAIFVLIFSSGFLGLRSSAARLERISENPQKFHQQIWNAESGLPQNTVLAIVQSKDGYLWVGTELGLARFDGLHFTIFDKANTPELKSNKIHALLVSKSGDLWIGTQGGGLSRLRKGHFETFGTKEGLSTSSVRCLYEDSAGNLWIGTESGGLNRFSGGKFTTYGTKSGLADQEVLAIQEDKQGSLWVGTHNGLSLFENGHFRSFRMADGLPSSYIRSLAAGPEGVLWVGTDGGLSRYEQGEFTNFLMKDGLTSNVVESLAFGELGELWVGTVGGGITRLSSDGHVVDTINSSLPAHDVWALFQDRVGDMWVGSGGGGLILVDRRKLLTTWGTEDGLSNEVVLPVFEDRQGTMWIGTNGGGLNHLRDRKITTLTAQDGLASNLVLSIAEDREGALWVGTNKGLSRLQDGKFRTFTKKDGLPANAAALYADRQGALWIGTRAGLVRRKNDEFTTFTTKDGLSSNLIKSILEDHQGRLWIGTNGGGLNVMENGKFRHFDSHAGLSSDVVLALHEDKEGTLWIGTDGGGLSRFRAEHFFTFTAKDGLLDDVVFRILEDSRGALWMSDNKGVFRAEIKALNDFAAGRMARIPIVVYGTADGMKTRECNGGIQPAGWKAHDGRLWFPTMKGVVVLDPAERPVNPRQQLSNIEGVWINQREVPLSAPIAAPVGAGNLEFRYSAPNFRAANRQHFEYRLNGFDTEWIQAGTRRVAYYTNIPPSHYSFEVRASDEDDTWSPATASIPVVLQPHFYQTLLFYILCSVGMIGVAGFWHRAYVDRLSQRGRVLEQHVQDRTTELRREIADRRLAQAESIKAREAAEQASRVKSEFLANMSHEIRTPMNGILGMTRLTLATPVDGKQRQYLEIIKDSADSLLIVIDDILDFSKVEAGKLELDPVDFNLRHALDSIVRSLAFRADQKGLKLSVAVEPNVPELIYADPVRLRQILLNLIGNSLKFTEQGEVSISVACDECVAPEAILRFVVRDTGIGIAREKLTSIFDAFSQADSSTTRRFGGTGLGLAICYRLVQLMGGDIWATSRVGQGSEFHFQTKVGVESKGAKVQEPAMAEAQAESLMALAEATTQIHILLAEDNQANRLVARYTLEAAGFKIFDVDNGSEAVAAVERFPFDLILMDCRMPFMDGYQATQKIRNMPGRNGQTPIIALTASAFQEDRERAEHAGMNDFVAKPFEDHQLINKCLHWARKNGRETEQKINASVPTVEAVKAAAGSHAWDRYSPEFLREMLGSFLTSAPPVFDKLMLALQAEDWAEAREAAHWLRGGATRMLGPELQEKLTDLEARLRESSPAILPQQITDVSALFTAARLSAEVWMSRAPVSAAGAS